MIDPMTGAALATTAAGFIGSMLNRPKADSGPDISGEFANIRALFQQLREQSATNINREAAIGRGDAAANLATRGVYSSPVSQNTFNRLEDSRLNALATSDANIGAQEAGARSTLLGKILDYQQQAKLRAQQANAGIWGTATGGGLNLLIAALQRKQNPGGDATTNLIPSSPFLGPTTSSGGFVPAWNS